jgi:hypothetical protein
MSVIQSTPPKESRNARLKRKRQKWQDYYSLSRLVSKFSHDSSSSELQGYNSLCILVSQFENKSVWIRLEFFQRPIQIHVQHQDRDLYESSEDEDELHNMVIQTTYVKCILTRIGRNLSQMIPYCDRNKPSLYLDRYINIRISDQKECRLKAPILPPDKNRRVSVHEDRHDLEQLGKAKQSFCIPHRSNTCINWHGQIDDYTMATLLPRTTQYYYDCLALFSSSKLTDISQLTGFIREIWTIVCEYAVLRDYVIQRNENDNNKMENSLMNSNFMVTYH